LFTPIFLNFFFSKICGQGARRQQVIPGGCFFIISTQLKSSAFSEKLNFSRKKNRKVGEPAKNVLFMGKQRVFLGARIFFPWGSISILFFSSFF